MEKTMDSKPLTFTDSGRVALFALCAFCAFLIGFYVWRLKRREKKLSNDQ